MNLKLKKGISLNLKGAIEEQAISHTIQIEPKAVGICPDDFPGFTPKVLQKEGTPVAAGTAILYDKNHPELKLVSPIDGIVKAVVRGERRKILNIEIEASSTGADTPMFDLEDPRSALAESGLLALMRQRPYDVVPDLAADVRDIFITAFDSAPLASDICAITSALFEKSDVEAGVRMLGAITKGKIYICHDTTWCFGNIEGAELVEVSGRYPASNVGPQIAAIKPINKGEALWTGDILLLARIGRFARTGSVDFRTIVGICGPDIKTPKFVQATIGAAVEPLIKGNVADDHHVRLISGNVFTGTAVDQTTGYLRYPYRQLTAIAEGDDVDEFMGWASLSFNKMSESPTFPGHYLHRDFTPDARILGGERATIMSGQLDRYFPMDILPEYLLKAIISRNVEDMERLGIYEVAPEDFAAAEYADTSKMPLQAIVRHGLDYLKAELG